MTDLVQKARENGVPLKDIVTELSGRLGANTNKLLTGGVPYEQLIPELQSRLVSAKGEEEETKKDFGAFERLAFKAKEANPLTENIGTIIGSYVPIGIPVWEDGGFQYKTAEEVWGKQHLDATPDARRKKLLQLKEQSLEQSNPELYASDRAGEQGEFGGAAGLAGTFIGTLADPSTLLAPQANLARMAAVDAVLGATWSVADQAAQTGKVDPKRTVVDTAIAGVAGPLFVTAAKGLGTAGRKVVEKVRSGGEMRSLDNMAMQLEDEIYSQVASGVELQPAIARARQKLDIDEDLYNRVQMKSTVKFRAPESMEEALEVLKYREGRGLDSGSRQGMLGRFGSKVSEASQDLIGTLDTQLGMISQKVKQSVNKYDLNLAVKVQEAEGRITPFVKVFNNIGNSGAVGKLKQFGPGRNEAQRTLTRALVNGDFGAAKAIVRREAGDEGVEALEQVSTLLEELHERGAKSGLFTSKVENYWPRFVEDFGVFAQATGMTQKSRVARELNAAAKAAGLTDWRALPQAKKQDIINQVYRGRRPLTGEGASPNAKARQVEDITDEMLDAYQDPIQAINRYIRSTESQIAKRELFGLDKKAKAAASKADRGLKEASKKTDYAPESILEQSDEEIIDNLGKFVNDAMEVDGLSAVEAGKLEELLKARFLTGEQSVGSLTAAYRNLVHTTLLGNPLSAAIQLGDLGISAWRNGLMNTVRSLADRTGNKISVTDFGLDNVIAESVDSFVGTAKLLNSALHRSGFKMVDRLGKNTYLRSSYLKAQQLSKGGAKGLRELEKKHGASFGDEFDELVMDLRAGEFTDRVKLALWNDLTSYQPVSLSQMPVRYLKTPETRILYALKTFGIKQIDMLRTEILHDFQKGNKAAATRKLATYMMVVPMTNATIQEGRNMLLGRDPLEVDDIPDAAAEAILRTFFLNEYMINRYGKNGEVASMAVSTITPPHQLWDDIGKTIFGAPGAILNGDLSEIPPDVLKHAPIFGGLINNFLLGGKDKFNERRDD